MKKFLLLLILFVFVCTDCKSVTGISGSPVRMESDGKTLKILSWNIWCLPAFVVPSKKRARAKLIADELLKTNYDIIVFQEAFHHGVRRILKKKLKEKFPHTYGPANKRWYSLKTNSGIWVLSSIPLKVLGSVDFTDCEGADCWARKGALMLEGSWHGNPFQIVGTHLEAGGPIDIKLRQYHEISKGLIEPFQKDSVPVFICGDMNTNSMNKKYYPMMLEAFDAEDGPICGEQQYTSDGKMNDIKNNDNRSVIDYILIRRNKSKGRIIHRRIEMFKSRWRKGNKDLSDHFAVSAEIAF